jgi:hypothetical protein
MKKIIIAGFAILTVAGLGGVLFTRRELPKAKLLVAIKSLNQQIEAFNVQRMPDMGVSQIEQRVTRVVYDRTGQEVQCFDGKDKLFLILKKQSDGRFKGIIEQPYHQLVGSGPDGSHSWGHILAEFYLEKE